MGWGGLRGGRGLWHVAFGVMISAAAPGDTALHCTLQGRAVRRGGGGSVTPTQGRSLLHGQDMGKTQNSTIYWRLAVDDGWLFLAAVLNKKKSLKDSLGGGGGVGMTPWV